MGADRKPNTHCSCMHAQDLETLIQLQSQLILRLKDSATLHDNKVI